MARIPQALPQPPMTFTDGVRVHRGAQPPVLD
jgi:hypothetical protein